METWKRVSIVLIGGILLRSVMNAVRYIQCVSLLNDYTRWLSDDKDTWVLAQSRTKFHELMSAAEVKDCFFGRAQPVGFGMIQTGSASVIKNFPDRHQDMAGGTISMLSDAIGVFRRRVINSFNPLSWIEEVLALPKNVLVYLGLRPEGVLIRLSLVLYWAISIILAAIYAVYKPEIDTTIRQLISE